MGVDLLGAPAGQAGATTIRVGDIPGHAAREGEGRREQVGQVGSGCTPPHCGGEAAEGDDLAVSADEKELLFVPDAHGLAWEKGTPLMAFDPATRRVRTIVPLEPLVRERLGLVAGGSYNIAVDQHTGRIFVGLNAGADTENPWGEVVLAVIEP
ncbi:MAG: hypothetical protein KDB39_16890 [Austwickia sp.]|nr:hypothetical protein [Austwickia sp.]